MREWAEGAKYFLYKKVFWGFFLLLSFPQISVILKSKIALSTIQLPFTITFPDFWIVSSITELFLKVHSSLSCIMLGSDNSSTQFLTSIINKTALWILVITETQLKGPCLYKTWAEYKRNTLYGFMSILRTCVTISVLS